jgi:predicted MFS family arabinose efflux permease
MFSRRLKTGYFALEGLNSFATVYFFYYLYFFMQKVYGFGNQANLMLAASNGATYAIMAWIAGRFAQRYGYFTALKAGYGIMVVSLGLGLAARSASGHIGVMVLTVVGMSFTWPTLEALVSEGEARTGLQHMVGIYNVVWAATAALGNFSGGAMLEKLGLESLFYIPMTIHAGQLALTLWLETKVSRPHTGNPGEIGDLETRSETAGATPQNCHATGFAPGPLIESLAVTGGFGEETDGGPPLGGSVLSEGREVVVSAPGASIAEPRRSSPGAGSPGQRAEASPLLSITKANRFLRMAWLANPFAYIAINTLIAVIPGVARRLELSTMAAGFCCSTWCFARLGAFALLWRWTAWHYRFRWLLLAYLGLVVSFGAVVLAPNLLVLVLAQLVFGSAVGLLYYSSLFYSMDFSETKGEHGGIHEAVIGVGNCAGPAVGALALHLVPQYSQSGTLAVILLLLGGLGGLLGIWRGGAKET